MSENTRSALILKLSRQNLEAHNVDRSIWEIQNVLLEPTCDETISESNKRESVNVPLDTTKTNVPHHDLPSSSNTLETDNQDNNSSNILLAEKDPVNNHSPFQNKDGESLSNVPLDETYYASRRDLPSCSKLINNVDMGLISKRSNSRSSSETSKEASSEENKKVKRPAKKLLPPCKKSCRLKCNEKVTEEGGQNIFQEYWAMTNLQRQRDFIASSMGSIVPKFARDDRRRVNRTFRFEHTDQKRRVCKVFFMATLGINSRIIRTIIEKQELSTCGIVQSEMRCKHCKHKVVSKKMKDAVRSHIKSIPRIKSHYCRAQTSKEYIEGTKTIADLYRD